MATGNFEYQVGMMGAEDHISIPYGSVVVDVTETTVTTVAYEIPGTGIGNWEPRILSITQRQFGVSKMPSVTGWVDAETASCIFAWFRDNRIDVPHAFNRFVNACHKNKGEWGADYRTRKFGKKEY